MRLILIWIYRLSPKFLVLFLFFFFSPKTSGSPTDSLVTRLVLIKKTRTLYAYQGNKVIKTYKVALGKYPIGPKHQEGDKRTPEGNYFIDGKNPKSTYHMALHLSYPNAGDRLYARKHHCNPGSDVEIHGLPDAYAYLGAKHREVDWTWGCIALTDQEIEELYKRVKIGIPIEIHP